VDDVRLRAANQPNGSAQGQRKSAKRPERERGGLDVKRAELFGEPAIPRPRDRNLELSSRQMADEMTDLLRPAPERRRGEQLEDTDHAL
jgi:hypothetical protein